jgi:hypothetical protein
MKETSEPGKNASGMWRGAEVKDYENVSHLGCEEEI